MGLIKAAIILGAGGYALNKYNKSRENHGGCGCKHNRNRDVNNTEDTNPAQGSWTPGTKVRGLPEYRDEKALPYTTSEDKGLEKEGWVDGEKESGGLRGTNGA